MVIFTLYIPQCRSQHVLCVSVTHPECITLPLCAARAVYAQCRLWRFCFVLRPFWRKLHLNATRRRRSVIVGLLLYTRAKQHVLLPLPSERKTNFVSCKYCSLSAFSRIGWQTFLFNFFFFLILQKACVTLHRNTKTPHETDTIYFRFTTAHVNSLSAWTRRPSHPPSSWRGISFEICYALFYFVGHTYFYTTLNENNVLSSLPNFSPAPNSGTVNTTYRIFSTLAIPLFLFSTRNIQNLVSYNHQWNQLKIYFWFQWIQPRRFAVSKKPTDCISTDHKCAHRVVR